MRPGSPQEHFFQEHFSGAFFRLTSRKDGAKIVKRFSSTDLANYIPDKNSLSWKILRRGGLS